MFCHSGVHQAKAEQYVDLVMKVGVQLKALLKSVYEIITKLPPETHEEVCNTTSNFSFSFHLQICILFLHCKTLNVESCLISDRDGSQGA